MKIRSGFVSNSSSSSFTTIYATTDWYEEVMKTMPRFFREKVVPVIVKDDRILGQDVKFINVNDEDDSVYVPLASLKMTPEEVKKESENLPNVNGVKQVWKWRMFEESFDDISAAENFISHLTGKFADKLSKGPEDKVYFINHDIY